MKELIYRCYKFLSAIKYQLLMSQFGVVSQCKHEPDCSSYWLEQTKQKGWLKGSWRGIMRFLSCR
ncbi:MAG: membrane protein insertion efficiency factor YidD [Candidatus Pacebacteria bacterium]|nr:membrane protein insertion efficiency factor YidD [Candidatus Paceibacterota bacterium]